MKNYTMVIGLKSTVNWHQQDFLFLPTNLAPKKTSRMRKMYGNAGDTSGFK